MYLSVDGFVSFDIPFIDRSPHVFFFTGDSTFDQTFTSISRRTLFRRARRYDIFYNGIGAAGHSSRGDGIQGDGSTSNSINFPVIIFYDSLSPAQPSTVKPRRLFLKGRPRNGRRRIFLWFQLYSTWRDYRAVLYINVSTDQQAS